MLKVAIYCENRNYCEMDKHVHRNNWFCVGWIRPTFRYNFSYWCFIKRPFHFWWFTSFAGMDISASSKMTKN